jgi:peptide/nickel transport system substrate-binding protein
MGGKVSDSFERRADFMHSRGLKAVVVATVLGTLGVAASACGKSQGSNAGGKDKLVFGTAGAPSNFDPVFAADGESFRVDRQIYETLIGTKPGTAEMEPGLAESWQHSADGKEWTFKLRKGVKFQDGTTFDAAAVCFNLDRWYHLSSAAAQAQAQYYLDVFGGFAKNSSADFGTSVYGGCQAVDDLTATVKLTAYAGRFPAAFTLTSLSMSSPTALKRYDADNVRKEGESFSYPAYAMEHPTGTGPYKFVKYDKANQTVTLERNGDYWGAKAKIKTLVFKVIPDENARKQELRAGTIDGYDLPSPADYQALRQEGFNLQIRDPFNILYLGINQKGPAGKLADIRVRKAIAYAINRDELVRTKLPQGAQAATQFQPRDVAGYANDVETYPYNPEKAKALLKEAGAEHLKVTFYYPTEVTRPYMPNPKEIFEVIADDLEAVGITVTPVGAPWTQYLDVTLHTQKADLHLLGWTGDYNYAANFVGTFFGRPKTQFGDENMKDMFGAFAKADATVGDAAQEAAWEDVNRRVMSEWLPAVPILHSPPGIVTASNVKGLVPSPLTHEVLNTVYFG